MIPLDLGVLPVTLADPLQALQAAINALPDYSDRVAAAKANWSTKPQKLFIGIRAILTEACSGAQRCMYCEDSCADEVEHIYPKNFYPEYVFVWENYLYVCGACNSGKSDKFRIITIAGADVTLTHDKHAPLMPPPDGTVLFLNPRADDPLQFLALDLSGTFQFVPMPGLDTTDHLRAEYTCTTLKLNREMLVRAREEAFRSYRARLREYVEEKHKAAHTHELDLLKVAIQRMQHPTVWREMQRQHERFPTLKDLFGQAPEALQW